MLPPPSSRKLCPVHHPTGRWPAVPLITVDPNFSVWSFADTLPTENTRHWTGAEHPLHGLLCVDGQKVGFCGRQKVCNSARQHSVWVDATATTYRFEALGVELIVRFRTPLLLDDLDLMARPASYVEFSVSTMDGQDHVVGVEFGVSPLLAVNERQQWIVAERVEYSNGIKSLRAGTITQKILLESGDDRRIEWGHVHLYAPEQSCLVETGLVTEWEFKKTDLNSPYPAEQDLKREAFRAHLLAARFRQLISVDKGLDAFLIVAYDDRQAAIEVAHRKVPGYWARHGKTFAEMLAEARDDFPDITRRCDAFDVAFNTEMEARGGPHYRDICALAYRQSIAGHKLVANRRGECEFHSKECFSNGCMSTVDVSYPSMPLFLRYNPELVKGMMRPVLDYARSEEWTFNFAPHDIGRYPKANGQAYGLKDPDIAGEFRMDAQMPVEECGNMLIMFEAVAYFESDAGFADANWDLVEKWARFLMEGGVDPAEQLCTDDFSGHLAHNANLAIKAIVGIGCFARLCEKTLRVEAARGAWETARRMVGQWLHMARDEAGHFRLAYPLAGSWSLKYNLVWDRILKLDLFPQEAVRAEWASYKPRFLTYGCPLDQRSSFTKSDWMVWCATMEDEREEFDRWIDAIWRMLNDTPHRVPFTDWFYADTATQASFQNRTVQGGLFAPVLLGRNGPGASA